MPALCRPVDEGGLGEEGADDEAQRAHGVNDQQGLHFLESAHLECVPKVTHKDHRCQLKQETNNRHGDKC